MEHAVHGPEATGGVLGRAGVVAELVHQRQDPVDQGFARHAVQLRQPDAREVLDHRVQDVLGSLRAEPVIDRLEQAQRQAVVLPWEVLTAQLREPVGPRWPAPGPPDADGPHQAVPL